MSTPIPYPKNQGPSGLSAYAVALKNGFVGTEAAWLASLEATVTQTAMETAVTEPPEFRGVIGGMTCFDMVVDFLAVGDGMRVDDADITAGDATLTSALADFTVADVGKFIRVEGAGVAGADLVTTIASYTSESSVELAAAAGTTVSGASAYYGTDNTLAEAAAYNAAEAAPGPRTLYYPPGVYLGRTRRVSPEVHILGAGGGLRKNFNYPTTFDLRDRTKCPTVLLPALATEPVLQYDEVFGNTIRQIMIAGGPKRVGKGLSLGGGGVSYTGSSAKIEQVVVAGFDSGYYNDGAVDIVHDTCNFVDSLKNVHFDNDASISPSDTCVFNSCITGGEDSDYCFYFNGSRCITINGGDHNLARHFMYMLGATVHITTCNSEQIQEEIIELDSGSLSIASGRWQTTAGTGPFISAYGPTVNVDIGAIDLEMNTATTRKGKQVIYRTGGIETPSRLPRGYAIERWSDYTFVSYRGADLTSWIYQQHSRSSRTLRISDDFVSRLAASPYGELGWTHTALTGATGGLTIREFGSPQSGTGTIELITALNATGYAGRFALAECKSIFPTTLAWRLEFVLRLNGANPRFRSGLYTVDAAPTIIPTAGVGVRFDSDGGIGDATLKFEKIVAGVPTIVDTGVTAAQLDGAASVRIVIEGDTSGLYCSVYSAPVSAPTRLAAEVSLALPAPASYVAPMLLIGTAGATYTSARLDRFNLTHWEQ